jgi:hypothetical protein
MRIRLGILALFALWALMHGGCGAPDLVIPGSIPFTATAGPMTPTASCIASGLTCANNSDCCSGQCILNICQ